MPMPNALSSAKSETLFLSCWLVTLASEVLWEQDAWNDLAKTLELRLRVFPWAVGYGKDR